MLSVSRDEITSGSITRSLVILAVPLVMQNFVQVIQQVVDTFWLGRVGSEAVAAVGLTMPIIALMLATIIGMFVGTQVLVSHRVGADEISGARRAAFHGMSLGLALGIVLTLVVLVSGRSIVSALTSNSLVIEYAVAYLSVYSIGFVVGGVSDGIEAGFVGFGDSRAALYVNVTAVVVNVVLDPFLIFGYGPFPELGVGGAALATVIGYGTGLILAVGLLFTKRNDYTFTRETFSFDVGEFTELVSIGYPNTLQQWARQTANLIIIAIVSTVAGAAGLAAYTVGARIAGVAYIPAYGFQQAGQSIVGQNLGANQPARADRATWVGVAIAGTFFLAIGAVQALFPELLATLFVPDLSSTGLHYTVQFLLILALGYWAIGSMMMFTAGFNGARRTKVSMAASTIQFWVVRLPFAAIGAFTLGWGVTAVFWAVTVSNILAAVGVGAYYFYTTNRGMLDRAAAIASGTPGD